MSLKEKMLKASTLDNVTVINESEIFGRKDVAPTDIPMLNVALSGSMVGGLTSGVTVIAGPTKCFKTLFTLILAAAYLRKHKDAILLFYDSEFGTPPAYLQSIGIDPNRVIHIPVTNIEELKFDVMQKLEQLKRGEKVFFMIDSIGNLASKKEVEDAMKQSSAADMTRAKQLKSFFRMITPHFSIKDIPFVAVNHIYMEQGMFPKAIVSGGTGVAYSADTIWIVTKSQVKEGNELAGWNFTIHIEKSRYVKEKKKIPITVNFDGGVNKLSGMFEVAMAMGLIKQTKMGWYSRGMIDQKTGEIVMEDRNFRKADFDDPEMFKPLFESGFAKIVQDDYSLNNAGENLIIDDSTSVLKNLIK